MNEKSLERAVLLQDVFVLLASLVIAHLARANLAALVPALKPAVPTSTYVHLLLVFVPTWAWCADRVGLYRVRTLAGSLVDLMRALLWTQVWGALALSLILVAAQAPLNRSLISLFLAVSSVLLFLAKLAQRAWVRAERGQILALVMGPDDAGTANELERLRGRRVERVLSLEASACRREAWTRWCSPLCPMAGSARCSRPARRPACRPTSGWRRSTSAWLARART